MIENFSKKIHRALKKKSGKVFYSGRSAFSGDRPLYILGYNPGGQPGANVKETVGSHTRKVLGEKSQNWSAYHDESWEGWEAAKHPIQLRVLDLLQRLSVEPGKVPASNLIFVRSPTAAALGAKSKPLAEMCWPFHQAVIEQLGVRIILCFGVKAAEFVKRETAAETHVKTFMDGGRVQGNCFKNNQGLKVIQVTHPSPRSWRLPLPALFNFVKRALKS